MPKEKTEGEIVGVSLLGALVATTIFLSIVQGELASPVGMKGGGLIFVVFFYFLFSVVLRRIFPIRKS
ncbi:MAG: hypothetical protein HY508_05020 [Acidobacteria bacterium]|nr:hypothetical protein [Acidobacteriota bacterium]